MAPSYADWDSFAATGTKKAGLWIGEVPVTANLQMADWSPVEQQYRQAVEEAKKCTADEQAKAENTFLQLECLWGLEDNTYAISLVRVEGSTPAATLNVQ
jgi:hypothetical protein